MASFVPRAAFPPLDSLPRSYYLGHHAAGLSKMRTMLSQIDLVIECRDYRLPLTSRNPMFEDSLSGQKRVIVYTKKDLGAAPNKPGAEHNKKIQSLLSTLHHPSPVLLSDHKSLRDIRTTLSYINETAAAHHTLIGTHLMIVGMPNVGKSSLLNSLRREGLGKGKVAHTGAQPGITRKIGTSVKIIENDSGGIYLLDTPGVFIPYVPDADHMLKLALCGSVKDSVIPPFTLADYLLYHFNLQPRGHELYAAYVEPTNDIMTLLEAVAKKTGRLQKGGVPDLEGTALWMIQRWRNGHLGRFLLDDVSQEGIQRYEMQMTENNQGTSLNQARKAEKEAVRVRNKVRRSGVNAAD